jgi:uncharacterized damage-inducible protein DinB
MAEVKPELVGVSEYVFANRIRPRLTGITDDEYFWEPVPGCWSVRPDADGVFRQETARLPDRQPFTTLAWRLWHLVGCYGSTRNGTWLGLGAGPGGFGGYDPAPPTAAAALEALDAAYAWWSSLLRSITEEQLGEMLGPIGGEYAEATKASFVLHQIDEVIHHGAEVALMRDLYRDTFGPPRRPAASVVEAAATGYWSEVRQLVEAGADVNATRPDDHDWTALQHAAAAAPLAVVRLLVERGADRSAQDSQFHADARGWAEYFGRADVVAYLEGT